MHRASRYLASGVRPPWHPWPVASVLFASALAAAWTGLTQPTATYAAIWLGVLAISVAMFGLADPVLRTVPPGRAWRVITVISVLALAGAVVFALGAWATMRHYQAQRVISERLAHITNELERFIGKANSIEYRMRDEKNWNREKLDQYVKEIDDGWRVPIGKFLNEYLPGSGAAGFFENASGEVGVGPLRYERSRLMAHRDRLASILQDLETWFRRSSGR